MFNIQNSRYLQDFVYDIYITFIVFLCLLPFIANQMAVLSVFQINTHIHLEKVPWATQ
jgi:hypothetical protein